MSNHLKLSGGIRVGKFASDPAGAENGLIYYNTTDNVFRKYEGGAWSSLSSAEVSDANFRIQDDGDPTKEIAFQASGITAGQTRTITMPDANVDLGDVNTAIQQDGSVSFTANQPMGGFKLTGLAAGSGAGDSVRYEQAILASGANAFAADQSVGGNKLTNVADPTAAQDAATKAYVDSLASGLDPKESVRAATTAALPAVTYNNGTGGVGATLTADANGALAAQDGITLIVADRLLVKNQVAALQNGIYEVTAVGDGSNPFILTRATDQDGSPANEVSGGNFTLVEAGTANEGAGFVVLFDGNIVVGTDAIDWAQFSSTAVVGGDMITVTGNSVAVDLATVSGLESSNPGNAAGQLRIKLEASNPSLQIDGSNQLGAKLDAAGAITSGASGLQVAVDDSTIERSANALRVKDAGITNAKVATGIDAVKLGDGSVSNTEFQYINSLTSNAQDQIDAKISEVVEDTDPELGGDLDVSGFAIEGATSPVLLAGQNSVRRAKQASKTSFVEEEYIHSSTLTASQTDTVLAALGFAHATVEGEEITYKIKEATTNAIRIGTLRVVTNGTDVSVTDVYNETADVGVTWSAVVNGANIDVRYSTTANAKTMRADIKRILA